MSFGWIVTLVVIYLVVSRIAKAVKQFQAQMSEAQKAGDRPGRVPPRRRPAVAVSESSQQEGFTLERILREIERVKAEAERAAQPSSPAKPVRRPAQSAPQQRKPAPQAQKSGLRSSEAGPIGRMARAQLPAAEEVEERETLEGTSLEGSGSLEFFEERGPRQEVDHDDAAEQIVQRRIAAAEARNRPLAKADHQVFDEQIRQAPADQTAARRSFNAKELRDAFVWREILGPPAGLKSTEY